ncbi:DNA primase [Candidatus Dependentiae bacterium]|nr:MAG: DNA primase [Candidatus Dependentiae bacterium]
MNIFSLIKSRISIFDVVSEYTSLKKAGIYWKATCPFHSEKDASFTVSPHKEIFYCFGCQAGGDIITFIEKIEQCSPLEAAHFLIERYNIDVPDEMTWEKQNSQTIEKKEYYFKVCEAVAKWAYQTLIKSHEAMDYLSKRGINRSSINDYMLGYFSGGQRGIYSLIHTVKRQNIIIQDLIEANIVSENKGYIYSPFEERIIFPIRDCLGRCCGFGGRVFKPNDERAKYYNSRENSYFQKGKLIFGLDFAKKSIQKAGKLFLVEGFTDCVTMRQHGFVNTISILGTACTSDHLRTFARYCEYILILYDGDSAGQQAIMRLTELCWQVSLELSVISLPVGEDPASFLSKGGDLNELVTESCDIFEFFLEMVGKDFQRKSLGDKIASVRKILKIIAGLEDSLKCFMLLQRASTIFSIPYDSLQKELITIQEKSGGSSMSTSITSVYPKPDEERQRNLSGGVNVLEKKIFFAIINNMQLFNSENEEYLIRYFSEPFQSILRILQRAKAKNLDIDFQQFFDSLNKENQRLVSSVLLECDQEIENKEFVHLLDQFRRKNWKRMVRALMIQVRAGRNKPDANEKLLHGFLRLKNKVFSKDSF